MRSGISHYNREKCTPDVALVMALCLVISLPVFTLCDGGDWSSGNNQRMLTWFLLPPAKYDQYGTQWPENSPCYRSKRENERPRSTLCVIPPFFPIKFGHGSSFFFPVFTTACDGALFPTKPHPSQGKRRADAAVFGSISKHHFTPVGAVLFWVCFSKRLASLLENKFLLRLKRWISWTCDAIDFFSVALSVPALEKEFTKTASEIVRYSSLNRLDHVISLVSRHNPLPWLSFSVL